MTTRRFSLLSALFLCLAISFAGTAAFASHLRGTSVSWSPTGTTGTVQFTIQYSQRTSAGGCAAGTCVLGGTIAIQFNFGDGSNPVSVNETITSVNSAEDYFSATGTVTHTYPGAGPYTAFYQNNARVSTIKSGENQNLRMETLVSPLANPVNHSPIASMPAIVTVPLQATAGFTVSAADQDVDNLSFRLSTAAEMYGVPAFSCVAQQPPGLSIDNSGQVTWDTTKITAAGCGFSAPLSGDLWTVQFMVQDLDSSNNVKSKVPVDLIIKFIVSTEAPPTLTLSNPGPITARPNTPLTFTVGSDDTTANSRVTLNVTGLPVGATNTNVNQTLIPPLSSTFSWTPTVAQAGSYVVTYTVTNDTFEQTLASVTINVPSLSPPIASCPVSLTAQYNTTVSIPVQVSDPQGDALTVVWSADGSSVRTDNVAASTSASPLTLSQSFTTLGPHTVSINATNSDNISSTCSTPITVTAADQVISFGTLSITTYGAPDTALSATSTSGLSVAFAATGSCSIVNGALHTTGPGSCSVTASQAGSSVYNAAPQLTQTFQITQRPLTVTAQDATRQFGFANPTFTGTISGIVNSDAVTATYSSTATITSPVNSYPIVPTLAGAGLSNYLVTITNGTLTVTKATGTLTAPTVSPANATFGTSVTITQAVPAGETGTVTFFYGTTVLGTATISNGVATLTTSALPAGTDMLTGQASGDTNFNAATSPVVSDIVGKAAGTLVALSVSPINAPYGTAVILTQTVPAGETGTVTFFYGTTVLGTATISNGVASLTTSALPAGTDMLTGQASGDANFNSATSPAVSDIVGKATPTLAPLSISPANAAFGTPVALSQTVPAGETGTVTFYNGTTVIGTATIINGVATLTTSVLPVGNDVLTAQVSGDANFATQTGPQTTDSVGKAASTLAAPTVSPMNSPYGTSVTLTQIVPADETGTVTFYNGTTVIGTGTIIKGVATLTTTALPAGSDSITAQTSGDTNYAPATTAAVNDTVSKVTPTLASMTLSPQNAPYGTSVTLTQSVPATETGTVTFYNGITPIGTATISNGVATLTTTALPAGSDSISAQVSGDSNYNAVTGAAVLDTVGPSPVQVTLTSTSTTLNPNQSVTFTATLASVGGTPSGTVQFYDGSTLLGTATLTGGVATFTTTLPAGSTNVITVQYPGSPVSAASQGNTALTVVVGALDFGYTLTTGSVSTQTVNVGAATSYNLTVAPLYGGFPDIVNFAVTGLPPGATYTLSPSTLQASSTGSSQVLTVQTSTAVASTSDLNLKLKFAPILLGMLIIPLAGSRRMRKSGNRIARNGLFCMLLILGAGAMASLTGCGTGNGIYHQGQQSFTLTVTATSASISHSVTVTLNEQ
jgi:hypothetical protein